MPFIEYVGQTGLMRLADSHHVTHQRSMTPEWHQLTWLLWHQLDFFKLNA